LTVTEAVAVEVSVPAVTVAVLLIVVQLACVVGEVRWTCLLAFDARSPKLQVSVPLVMEQPVSEPAAIDQLRPAVVGRVSETVTAIAVPAPLFVAVMRKPIGLPDATLAASAVFVRLIAPQFTVWLAELKLLSRLTSTRALSMASFVRPSGQSARVAVVLTVMVRVEPFVIVPKLHESRPEVIEQALALAPPTDHVWPAARASVSVTCVESPVPPAVTTIVKVTVLPALTAAPAVFRTETSGHRIVTVAGLVVEPWPSLPEPKLALLSCAPQLATVEGAVAVKLTVTV
jgi:hypothetical protein